MSVLKSISVHLNLFVFGSYLIKRCLRHGIVLDAELFLGVLHAGEELCQRQALGGQLVLQHVVVLLPQHGLGEALADEALDGVHVGVVAAHPQDDGVAIAKPEQRQQSRVSANSEQSQDSLRSSSSSSSNWILKSCQPHRVTSGQPISGHKQIHVSKLFSHIYQPSVKSIYKTNHFTNLKHTYTNIRHTFSKSQSLQCYPC